MAMATIMAIDQAGLKLVRLMTWLSPAFPIGGFAYSGGLESAVDRGLVKDADGLKQWLTVLMTRGVWWNDAVLLAEAWRACNDQERLDEALSLAQALAGSLERHLEITMLGEAFVAAAASWPHDVLDHLGEKPAYAVAVGAVASAHDVDLSQTLAAFLHALASQAVSASIRLGVIGQKQGVAVLAGLEQTVLEIADAAEGSSLADLGSASFIADIVALAHESQHSRLFRS